MPGPLPPCRGTKPKVAVIATHYQIDFSEHYLADYLAARGMGFLGWNTRFRGFESSFAARPRPGRHRRRREMAARDTGRGNRSAAGQFRRRLADGRLPVAGRRPERHPAGRHASGRRSRRAAARRRLHRQRGAPGPARSADHLDGRRRRRRERPAGHAIPTSTSSTSATARPTPPSSSPATEPRRSPATTRSPTGPRPNSTACSAAGFSDRPFTVMRTWADPRMVDPAIEPTNRQPNMCYAGVPVKANRSARGIAAACTLRNWLGMWSLKTAQTRAEPHLARITCPALVINAEQDTGVFPSDAAADLRRRSPAPTRPARHRHRPLLHDAGGAQRAGRHHREVDRQAMA